jgi:hypothetical protein
MDEFLSEHDGIERVIVVCFGSDAYAVCRSVAREL